MSQKMEYFYYENGYALEKDLIQTTTWKEIYLDRLFHNLDIFRSRVGPDRKILLPVKANAYGHGLIAVAQALQSRLQNYNKTIEDYDRCSYWLGVANLLEGITLRRHGIVIPILVLGPTNVHALSIYKEHNLRPTVASLPELNAVLEAFAKQEIEPFPYHIKIDTGMGRLGIVMPELENLLKTLHSYAGLGPEGIYSHLATADEPKDDHAQNQIENFYQMRERIEKSGLRVAMWHLANSGGLLNYENIFWDMVRPGIASYGYYPSESSQQKALQNSVNLQPVMELKSRVSSYKTLPPGHGVSYGKTFVTEKPSQMSVVPMGYGDGFPRILSNDWPVLFEGDLYPIRGRVSMDQIVIEASPFGPKVGDVVTILGGDDHHSLWADVWAQKLNTIPYEVLCGFSARVPMIYYSQ